MDSLAQLAVVEDDPTIRTILEMALAGAGFRHVRSYARGDDALAGMRAAPPDLILLDVMLPGLDGFSVARAVRSNAALSRVRIIMITARGQNEDVVEGLEAGADDYVAKPFDRKVLLARIRAVLRRGEAAGPDGGGFDGLSLDEGAMAATLDGAPLDLTPGEFRILALLCANRGRVLTRRRILDSVLSDDNRAVTERTIDVQVATLRRKLGRWAEHVGTVRGVGYRVGAK